MFRAKIGEKEFNPSLDNIFKTVKMVLEFRADGNLKKWSRFVNGNPMTARKCGLAYPKD